MATVGVKGLIVVQEAVGDHCRLTW